MTCDNEIEEMCCDDLFEDAKFETDDMWYDLFDGGRNDLSKIISNPDALKRVKDAIAVLEDFKDTLEAADALVLY